MPRIESLRCKKHTGTEPGYCRACIEVQAAVLRQSPDFQRMAPIPDALAEKLGVGPWKPEWDYKAEDPEGGFNAAE